MTLDPVDYAVISQAVFAATTEMGAKLVRSAYSTIVREASDAAAAILDPEGNTIAQAELIPVQLGSLEATLRPCMDFLPAEALREGDFYITNDPYHGGQHLPDIFIFTPIFFEGNLIAFSATVAHHIDVGGGAPGLNMTARELIQEGLVIPPSRYNLQRDWNGGPFQRLIAANVRVPEQTIGDLNAQFAGSSIGAARLQQLCHKYGVARVDAAMSRLLDYCERRMRTAIAEAPDGTYVGEDRIDDDSVTGGPVLIRATVTIAGDAIAVDFRGSSPQTSSNINCPFASTLAATYGCIKAVLTDPTVPFNAGSIRPISVTAPYGSILNPQPPAPVRARMTPVNRVFNAVMKSLAQAVPDKAIATGFDTTTGPYLSRRGSRGYRVYHEVIGGGYGASAAADGCSGVDGPMSNCANVPTESLDMDFDYFRVVEYALIPDSGGAGRTRGGLGIRRRYEILKDGVQYAQYGDRFLFQPEGLFGGGDGAAASVSLTREGRTIALKSKDCTELRAGDILTVCTGGGAGYGPPVERAREQVLQDVREGFVTPEGALNSYDVEPGPS